MIEPAPLELIEYRDYLITRAPLHVPFKYEFVHKDYDGAPEHSFGPPGDNRCGVGDSVEDCIEQIDAMEAL